jgi:hypothetical protein
MGQSRHRERYTVAVCIPTIPPRADLLHRAMASVLEQTRQPDRIVVQLDEIGEGAGPTRNRAWAQTAEDFVAFLDDDDEFLPDHLEACMAAAERTRADVIYPWFHLVGWPEATLARPDPLATMRRGKLVHPLGVPFGPEQAEHMRRHAFIPSTIVVRRSALAEVAGYPDHGSEEYERFQGCEDWALLVRLLDAGARFEHIPRRTYRIHLGVGTAGVSWREHQVGA